MRKLKYSVKFEVVAMFILGLTFGISLIVLVILQVPTWMCIMQMFVGCVVLL